MAHALENKKTDTNFILMCADKVCSEMQCTFLYCRAIVMRVGIVGSEVQWKAVIRTCRLATHLQHCEQQKGVLLLAYNCWLLVSILCVLHLVAYHREVQIVRHYLECFRDSYSNLGKRRSVLRVRVPTSQHQRVPEMHSGMYT